MGNHVSAQIRTQKEINQRIESELQRLKRAQAIKLLLLGKLFSNMLTVLFLVSLTEQYYVMYISWAH